MSKEETTQEIPTQEKASIDNIGEAISVLVQAVHIAQSKGVYSFADSAKVGMALAFIETAANAKGAAVKTEEVDKTIEK